jgi:hypothetical protein
MDTGRCRAGADSLDREAVRPQGICGGAKCRDLVGGGRRPGARGAVAVTAVGEDTDHVQARVARPSRDRQRCFRAGHAAAPRPGINLDEDPQPIRADASHRRGQAIRRRLGVDADRQARRSLVQPPQPVGLDIVGPDRIADEDVLDRAVDHDFGLAERPDRDADRSAVELKPGERDRFVGLDVGPQRDAAGRRASRHPPHVRIDDVEIDDQAWSVEAVRQSRRDRHPKRLRRGHRGRSTTGVRSSPRRSTRSVTTSPGSR